MNRPYFELLDISGDRGFEILSDSIHDDAFQPGEVIQVLSLGVGPACKQVLVEHSYNDKDYRSTYYSFYAKKGYRYEINCIRLHFFDERVELLAGHQLRFSRPVHDESYFGFMVLRPTRLNTIGRSVLKPKLMRAFQGQIIQHEYEVHLLGHSLHVSGFPYMSQHTDIGVCAHVACWAILRHYSERYARYREILTFDITRLAHEFDPGGLIPSKGLRLENAERIFASAGTYPVMVTKDPEDPEAFYRQMFSYVESGFPLFVALEGHAIAVIGHLTLTHKPDPPRPCTFAWDLAQGVVAIDDNRLPYLSVLRKGGAPYGCDAFTDYIVPLPDKVYYPAEAVDGIALLLATEPTLGFDPSDLEAPVVRYFLTTAAHLRKFMHDNRSQFDPTLVAVAMELSLPQFVWIIEIASETQWRAGQVELRAILDATAGPYEDQPLFLLHNQNRAYVSHRGGDHTEGHLQLKSPTGAPMSKMLAHLKS
jgi:hypothetical protein